MHFKRQRIKHEATVTTLFEMSKLCGFGHIKLEHPLLFFSSLHFVSCMFCQKEVTSDIITYEKPVLINNYSVHCHSLKI